MIEPTTHTVVLHDGRTLAYGGYGVPFSPAAHAAPIFYFHGYPASHFEAAIWSAAAARINLTLIAADRPGMGLSTFQRGRTITDWASDVVALADHLQVRRFRLLGVSGGAPYVLACLKEIPAPRLGGAAIVSGLYPLSLGATGMLWESRALLAAARWMPSLVGSLVEQAMGRAARAADRTPFDETILKSLRSRPEVDTKCMDDPDVRETLLNCVRQSLMSGSEGMAWEAKLFGSPWGFELDELRPPCRLTLWHGGKDRNSPLRMASEAVKHLRGATLNVFDDDGHLSTIVKRKDEVLDALIS